MATLIGRRGHPTAQRAAAIDAAIVDATLTLFSVQGSDFSMDQVAAAADVSKQAIYRRFDSKQALILHTIEAVTAMVIDDASRDMPDDPVIALQTVAQRLFARGGPDALGASFHLEVEAIRSPIFRDATLKSRQALDHAVRARLIAIESAGRRVDGPIRVQAQVLLDLLLGANMRMNTERSSDTERARMFAERWAVFRTLAIRDPGAGGAAERE